MSEKEKTDVTSLILETLLRFEEEKLKIQRDLPWYKKPIGAIIIGVSITIIATGIITFFTSFQGSQKGLILVQSEITNINRVTLENKSSIKENGIKIDKVDDKIDGVKDNLNTTDKEWRDAVTKFYKDNPQLRSNDEFYNDNPQPNSNDN